MSWHEKAEVTNLSVGDIVLSYDINEEKIIEVEIIDRVEELYSDGKETFAISTGDYGINLTIFHIIPYYRDGELIIDNCGTVDVGDELIIIDEDELTVSREKVILVEEGITVDQIVYHPKSSNGYYFINRILLHD